MTDTLTEDDVLKVLDRDGYAIVPGAVPPSAIAQLRRDLETAIATEIAYHRGTDYVDYGMVLVCCTHARSFVDILAERAVMGVIERILGEGCIIYAYTSSSMPPHTSNYSQRIHVDCPRLIPGYETNAGVMVLLDDFTLENGASWVLPASQHTREAPSADYFFANAKRIVAPAGSVVYLNPRVWHAGGQNKTGQWRHSITLNMCRPYMKQRLDIPKMMAASAVDLTGANEKALQKMGFYAQVPESLDEYYLPPDQRKFRQKAE
jgi:ectoine hydroxylase-related dioxygenase (phytanoyl-CoA dioxygenase family)